MSDRTPSVNPPFSAADMAGETPRGQAEYNKRRSYLRSIGIEILDRYNQDQLDDESDPDGSRRFWQREAVEKAQKEAQERAWAAEDERARTWLPKGRAL